MEEYKVDGYQFDNKAEYEQALREQNTINNIREKMNLNDAKIALSLYNQAVAKRTFKTAVGYSFLKKLRDTIISSGLVDDSSLNSVPVVSEETPSKSSKSKPSPKAGGQTGAPKRSSVPESRLQTMYENEKKRRILLSFVVAGLIAAIVGMFVLTFRSKYSYITYFTDYEENIRNDIIDEYEEWREQLEEKEKSLNEREEALGIEDRQGE